MNFSYLTCNKIILFFQYLRQNVTYHIKPFPLILSHSFLFLILFFAPLIWSSIKISCLRDNPSHCFIHFRSPQTFLFQFCVPSFFLYLLSLWTFICQIEHYFNRQMWIHMTEHQNHRIWTVSFSSDHQISPLSWCSVHAISQY